MCHPSRYIYRFIHVRHCDHWTVKDTLTGRTLGRYAGEADAVEAALVAVMAESAFKRGERVIPVLPLL